MATEQYAAVGCGADDRQALEQMCRTITRPALANERVQTNAAGQVVLELKTAWRDRTTHPVLRRDANSPVDCPNCGGELKIIAAILEQPVTEKILTHPGLRARTTHARPPVGRSCKGPEILQPTRLRFRPPGAQGGGDRLRQSF